jgi:uncharacterized membrane protein
MHRDRLGSDYDFGDFKLRARQESDASTALPPSPVLSRMVSPADSACDAITEKSLAEFELTGFEDEKDEIYTPSLSAKHEPAWTSQLAKNFEDSPSLLQTASLVFLPVMAGVIMYITLISPAFCRIMSAIALLMALPGIYLWVIDGSRPEDYEENMQEHTIRHLATSRFLSLGLAAMIIMPTSTSVLIIMAAVAALMLLPGIYLWVADGCRPEDYERKDQTQDGNNSGDVMLARLALGIVFGMWYSRSFRIFQGILSVIMFLPGLYLWIVEGCRPEDYDGNCRQRKAGYFSVLKASLLAGGTMLIMKAFVSISMFLGIIAAIMLLPGIYLWVVDGCRPEDYEEDRRTEDEDGCSDMLARLVLGSMIGMWLSQSFRILQGITAMVMLVPGMYLWVIDGCRPEDYEETSCRNKVGDLAILKLGSLCLGLLIGAWISTSILIFVMAIAALMLLPGIYLWVVDGARPEDYMAVEQIKQD